MSSSHRNRASPRPNPRPESRKHETDAWFAPKRIGYGAGLPIVWQGWAALALYILAVSGGALLASTDPLVATGLIVASTAIFLLLAARKTKGGWRWRNGED